MTSTPKDPANVCQPRASTSFQGHINRAVEDSPAGVGQSGRMELPRGLVTFLLTDVEGSTAIWRADGDRAAVLMKQVSVAVEGAVVGHGGVLPKEQGEGDSAVAVFERPDRAIAAALDLQLALAELDASVRVGVHTGLAEVVDDSTYGGTAIIRAARVRDLGRGGEVLVSQATSGVVAEALPDRASLVSLGLVQLKGFDTQEPLFRLEHPDLVSLGELPSMANSSLPTFPTSFIGRSHEQAEIRELLDGSRLVTITGAGGSGKTRLAHVIAETVEAAGETVAWLDLTAVSDPDQVPLRALEACGQLAPTETEPREFLLRHLSAHPTFLVIDNCEHLLDAVAAVVGEITSSEARATILTTSREPLGVAGETTWRIPSLSLPAGEDLEEVAAGESVSLFLERARSAGSFELDAASAPAVVRICRRLDGIPLALELAAARMRSMSVEDLADRLDDRFALLTSGQRGAMERQRTLLASVQWSHDLLDDPDRVLLRRLSVFRAPFRLAAAESVAGDGDLSPIQVLDGLTQLVDKSLVQHRDGRYSLLETIRAFAADRAGDAGELESLRDRHLEWALRRTASWGWPYQASASVDIDEQIAEGPDLSAALDWCWGRRPEAAVRLLPPLCLEWVETGNFSQAPQLIARAGAELGEGSPEWLEFVSALAGTVIPGGVLEWVGPAMNALAERPDISSASQARIEQAFAILQVYGGDLGALDELRRTGEVCRAEGDEVGAFMALSHEVFILATAGRTRQARPILGWLDAHGQPEGAWWVFDLSRAIVAASEGDGATALLHLEAQLAAGKPIACFTGAYHALQFADLDLAHQIEKMLSRRTLDGWYAESQLVAGAVVALLEEDWERAREAFASMAPTLGGHNAMALARAAELDLLLDGPEAASRRLSVALDALGEGESDGQAMAAAAAVDSLIALTDDPEFAVTRATQALAQAVEIDHHVAIAACLQTLAVALAAQEPGKVDVAWMLGAADGFVDQVRCRWAGPVHAEVVAELRERVDAAGHEEGSRQGLLDAASAALAQFQPKERPPTGWASLTAAEERVVALVGEGLSNPEIADELYVSVSTIKTHLVHAYQKLQIDSRSALAAAAATRK